MTVFTLDYVVRKQSLLVFTERTELVQPDPFPDPFIRALHRPYSIMNMFRRKDSSRFYRIFAKVDDQMTGIRRQGRC
jgi:hypothetical protein